MFKKYIEKSKSDQSGFTLIELIIVITVLGVIVAAFLPRTGGNVEKTKQVMHENLLNTISSAIAEYGTENELTASDGGNLRILTTGNIEVPDASNEVDTLLRPIDKEHPLVKGGYLDKVPQNPWASESKFAGYKYMVDFKITTRVVSNPDGSTVAVPKLIPVTKLAKVSGNELSRDEYIVIVDGETKNAKEVDKSKLLDEKIYGYNFENGKEIGEDGEDKEAEEVEADK